MAGHWRKSTGEGNVNMDEILYHNISDINKYRDIVHFLKRSIEDLFMDKTSRLCLLLAIKTN